MIYKIVSKIIVLRLKNITDELIAPFQSSFIPGRKGTDNVLILQELVFSFKRRKGKEGDMIVKLDIGKAYDCIKWSFVRDALIVFNFLPILISIIMSYISSIELSIVINGGITKSFQPSRGLC